MRKSKLVDKAADVMEYRPKPSLSIDAKDLPAIKDWKIGHTYDLQVTAKMVSIDADDDYSGGEKTPRARFRITKVTEK
jgi:hypothetical protein